MQLVIRQFEPNDWAVRSAQLIQECVIATLAENGHCSVMLTGGRSAERLYAAWAENDSFQRLNRADFYFGDERCVAPDHAESNYGLAMRSLFRHGIPNGCSVYRMEAEDPDRASASLRYTRELPEAIDVLLLGVGEDGHIASLFPGSDALKIDDRMVIHVSGPKPPHERMTVTPPVIAKARSVFVLAAGAGKAQILARVLKSSADIDTMPARLASKAVWLLDRAYSGNEK